MKKYKEVKDDEQELAEIIRLMFEVELEGMKRSEKLQEKVEFSDGFERRMERLIKSQRRKAQIRKAVKYALSAAAVLLVVFCLIRPGIAAKAWDVVVRWHSTHLEVGLPDAEWTGPVPEYELTYVPEGFVMTRKECDEFGGFLKYDKEDDYFHFSYSIGGGNNNYDNERSKISVVKDDDGTEILLVEWEEDGFCSTLWQSKEGLTFSLDGYLTKEEIFKMRDGIRVKK